MNVLIIHELKWISTLIHKFLLAELTDPQITEVASTKKGLEKIQKEKFDAIICGEDQADMDGPAFYQKMLVSPLNKETPFILIVANDSKKNMKKLVDQGIKFYLNPPFTSPDLGAKVDSACNPRRQRKQERISIPGTKAFIRFEHQEVEGNVVNISMNGILCDIEYSDQYMGLLKSAYVSVQFPAGYQSVEVKNLVCRYLRSTALSWKENDSPARLQLVWCFTGLADKNKKRLAGVFDQFRAELKQLQESS